MLAVGRRRGFETTVAPSLATLSVSVHAPSLTLDGGGQTVEGFTPDDGFFASGSIQHGETMTIAGSGFGTKAQAAPVLWDFGNEIYENGSLNTRHEDTAIGAAVPEGNRSDLDVYSSVTGLIFSATGLRHSRIARHYQSTGTENGFLKRPYAAESASASSPTEQWYLSWRQRFDQPVAHSSTATGAYMGSLKTLRLGAQPNFRMTNRINACPTFFWSWQDGGSEVRSANACPHNRINQYSALQAGTKWYLHEIKIWRRGDGLMGGSEFWDLLYGAHWDVTNQQASFSENMSWTIEELGMDGTVDGGIVTTFGEVYFDNSTKRIAIGNASTWAACTEIELQRPIAWANNEISFAMNHGAFSLSGKYLYWVETNSSGEDVGTRMGVFT